MDEFDKYLRSRGLDGKKMDDCLYAYIHGVYYNYVNADKLLNQKIQELSYNVVESVDLFESTEQKRKAKNHLEVEINRLIASNDYTYDRKNASRK